MHHTKKKIYLSFFNKKLIKNPFFFKTYVIIKNVCRCHHKQDQRLTADYKERATWKYSYGEVFCALTSWPLRN